MKTKSKTANAKDEKRTDATNHECQHDRRTRPQEGRRDEPGPADRKDDPDRKNQGGRSDEQDPADRKDEPDRKN